MTLNRDNLQRGKYYCGWWGDDGGGGGKVIVKLEKSSLYNDNYYVTRDGNFKKYQCLTGNNINFREATPEEIFWLDQCISQGKGIKFEDIDFSKMGEVQYEIY